MTDPTPNPSDPKAPGRLADLLVKHGLVTAKQVEAARALQGPDRPNLVKALVDLGFVNDSAVTTFLVKALKYPYLSLQDYQIHTDTLKLIPREMCSKFRVLPIDILGKNLTVAMVNPLDEQALAAIQQQCPEFRLKAFVCAHTDFDLVFRRLFAQQESQKSDGSEMSLASLGMSPAAKKPAPKVAAPADSKSDASTETMLFDAKMAKPAQRSAPLRSSLICLDGWELGREIEIKGKEHTLGRSPDVDTTVASPLISREHARITRNEEYGQETFVITDLKSSNGTFVNNVPVTTTILRHGDRILLGNVLFKFVLLDEIEARFHKDVHHLYSIHKGTGLLPADGWMKELDRALGNGSDSPLVACLIEIDNLPQISQSLGQIVRVIALSDVSDLLQHYLDKSDLPGDFGDGRIAVTFEGKPLEKLFPQMEDFRCLVESNTFHHKEESFRTTISIGLAAAPRGCSSDAFIKTLRGALEGAIAQGRNNVAVASE